MTFCTQISSNTLSFPILMIIKRLIIRMKLRTIIFVSNLEWCTRKYNVGYGTVKERQSINKRGQIK